MPSMVSGLDVDTPSGTDLDAFGGSRIRRVDRFTDTTFGEVPSSSSSIRTT
jgi:hypothetical protein